MSTGAVATASRNDNKTVPAHCYQFVTCAGSSGDLDRAQSVHIPLLSGAQPMQSLAFTPTESQLVEHRRAMLRFARRKIRDEALAEDTVQDALLAALSARSSFQGQSALRTWLIGILNHKIQDAFRRETRYVKIEELSDRADADSASALAAADHPVADDDPVVEVSR
ncbi:MAG TPA: sigma-70 family RNA polymerase sigma factor, partial [Burkholderiaceae bacterium]|nr:sigma-70 family RNA polymerase sigma factor [Burkholderiaceae bacterium]